ncbi:hydrocephalus-inducing protein homolog [Pogoniulus pusillus]|uniref:hydrocephalus-inducing protein homolog n=1 Tax=Pogoniulus pusillus TaxID=488313 RepID=UPI0030B97432
MEPSLPRIIQQQGRAEERRLPRVAQRLGSSRELWLPPVLTKRGSTQEGKLPPLPLTCGSSQEGKLPLLTRRGNPGERKLPPGAKLPASSGVPWPKVLAGECCCQQLKLSLLSLQLQLPAAALEQSCFEPCPAEVVFRHCVPHRVYEMLLALRNKGRAPQRLKVTLESSPYFKLVGPKDVWQKVAPGMVSTYSILFSPEENKGYCHQLRCTTEREEFTVPIRAVGAQAVLDLPQQLDFSSCPVKHSSQRTLLLRNVGEREAQYSISTQSPFSAAPSAGALGAGEAAQVTVGFLPLQRGDHCGSLSLRWDTGEAVHSRLRGTAVDVDVRLERSSLTMEQTYLSLCTRRTLLIHNGSDVLAHFQWKASAQQEDGQQKQRLRFCESLWQGQEQLRPHPPEEQRPQSALRGRSSWLSRIFQQQREKAQEDSLLCPEGIFSIEPLEGDVWPKSSAEVQVIFSPRAARAYEARLYCDISGREARLPLHIRGEGLGPWLCFQLDQLDIGQVFAGSTNRYKMVLHNKGAIDAFFSLVPPATAVGSCFTFSPCQGLVQPEKFQELEICFCATTLGPFTEEFVFQVEGCPEPVTSTIRGCVTAPTLHFDVPCLQFGDVSFGFPQSLCCRLTNASLVPVAFTLRVPGDGRAEPSVPSAVQVLDSSGPSWRKRVRRRLGPREFTISPCSGTIRSRSFVDIQVTLCSNSLGTYELALVVDVDGVGQELLSLPLTARCVVPALHVPNPVVTFGHCYLQLPAQQTLTLVNDSDLPGCYGLLPQKHQKAAAVLYSSPVPCGIIQPHSSVEVPLTLEALVPGRQETRARVAVFGRPRHWLEVCLVSIGEGPVVSVQPSEVDFGSIQVLQDASRTLRLCNQSPIPASFQAEVAGKGSCWRIEPRQGVIPPEGEASVCITANLADTQQFQAEVQLQVEHSRGYGIPVRALGIGTTIVTDRPLAPQLSLGTRFSLVPCCYSFKVSNHGRRTQRLYWSTAGGCQPGQRQHLPAPSSSRGKACQQSPTAACPVFRPRPMRMELAPGQTMELTLEGFSSTAQVVREQLLCHSVVGSEGRKNKIMQVALSCQFVAPALQMSSRALTFRVEKQAGDVLTPQEQALSLKNVCPLPLSMVLSLGQPFSICDVERQPLPAGAQPLKLEAGEELQLSISFNPALEEGLSAWQMEQPLTIKFLEHPHEEQVLVRGEVPSLQFQSRAVDFGCILNHTAAVHSLEMTNCSPLPVSYCWLLLPASQGSQLRYGHLCPLLEALALSLKLFFLLSCSCFAKSKVVSPGSDQCLSLCPGGSNPSSCAQAGCSGHRCPAALYCSLPAQAAQQEAACWQRSVSPGSSCRAAGVEEPAQALGAVGDPAQEPADADESLEAELLLLPSPVGDAVEGAVAAPSHTGIREFVGLKETEPQRLGLEEVFDVLPLHGVLQPGQSQQVTFSFFGHPNIVASARALCKVQGGPSYEVKLSGEASLISYLLESRDLDVGMQPWEAVTEAEVTLHNSGKLPFTFMVPSPCTATARSPLPGLPLVVPSTGSVGAGQQQVLKIYYLPEVPGVFCETLQIQVGHLETEEISLRGEGGFPRICLDLPRNISGNKKYEKLLRDLRRKLAEEMAEESERDGAAVLVEASATATPPDLDTTLDTGLQLQLEDFLLKQHILGQQEALACSTPEEAASEQQRSARRRLLKAELPEYILDFGCVTLGGTHKRTVKVTNPGQLPVSFKVHGQVLRGTGFSVDLECVKQLPCSESRTFTVCLDPQSATLPLGETEVLLPIKVAAGPTFRVLLRAKGVVPSLCLSRDRLEFSRVQCGQCREETTRLYNPLQVPCRWFVSRAGAAQQGNRHFPASRRQELKAEAPVFEVLPSAGVLAPGQWCNLQVRFAPVEEKPYSSKLKISVCQSSQHLQLLLSGSGLEPRLEFQPQVLDLGPVLPSGPGTEGTVVVRNPCEFPIEFYSLEFDQEYLAEEQLLRALEGYDCCRTLLLPPRSPGEQLPPELLEVWQAQERLQEQQAQSKTEEPTAQDEAEELQQSTRSSKKTREELEVSPFHRALAHHLGIAVPGAGAAAPQCKGIVVIIHGAPLTGGLRRLPQTRGVCRGTREAIGGSAAWAKQAPGLRAAALRPSAGYAKEPLGLARQPERRAGSSRCRSSLLGRYQGLTWIGLHQAGSRLPALGSPQHTMSPLLHGSTVPGVRMALWSSPEPDCPRAVPGGKTSAAPAVAQHYGAACLSLEAVVSEALAAGSSQAGRRARALCAMAARRQQAKDGRLGAAAALRWRRSTRAILSSPLRQSSSGGKGRLSRGGSVAAGLGLGSCVLPEELLVAILSERLQLSDCSQGVVFDGLQTSFAGSTASALLCLLRAVGNRPHIYLVNLHQDFASWQARQRAAEKRAGREQEEAARREVAQLWELGEEEFDALPQEQKAQLESRIRQLQRQRKQRVLGQLAGEPGHRQQQGLQHQKEADVRKQDKRKPGRDQGRRRQSLVGQGTNTSSSSTNVSSSKQKAAKKGTVKEHPGSDACKEEQRKQSKAALAESCSGPDAKEPGQSGSQKDLALRFRAYEASRAAVAHVLSCWDRVQGVLSPSSQAELQLPSKWRLQRAKKKEHRERELLSRANSAECPEVSQLAGAEAAGAGSSREVGVPCLDVEVQSSAEVASTILGSGKLPRAEQVLDELGLGPSGPPIPPPALYSVVRYPAKREVAAAGGLQRFVLLVPEEEAPDGVRDASAAKVPGQGSGRGRRRLHRPGSRRPSRRSPERDQSHVGTVPPPERSARRSPYRWVVPAQGQVELQIRFSSSVRGQFEQRLHFELLGTQRCYQLHCRGTCLCPSISQEPRVVFPRCRKNKAAEDIIFKEYVLSTGVFHFGPLLCGKARDWSKALLQPGNCEKFTICNVSPWEAEVHFSFEQDGCGNTFVLEPACMKLGPYEKQELRVCAYPTAVGLVQDRLICCIKDNPEPVVFQLCCQGVQLKLGVSPKQLSFGRVLLKREHSRSLVLRNSCPLPVAWRLSGLESLGEGFSVCQCQGTVGPQAELGLQLCFRPTKPLSVEKMLRLEVSDAEDVQGVLQIENIQVSAKAYEVALDITLPGGGGGCVDFGVVKVLGRAKQVLSLQNRGRYKIAYRFRLHPADPSTRDVASHFTVQPQRGLLPASQQAVSVQLLFQPQREITIEGKPILLCQVLEPGWRAGAEPVATIPVRLSAKAVFSQYSISPAALLDCGAMVSGTSRACSFLLENRGLLPLEFLICKAEQAAAEAPKKRRLSQSHRKQSLNGRSAVAKQDRPLVPEETKPSAKARLTVGMFTVSPAFGCILPGHQQAVTVECAAGVPGPCQEQLLIDISGRDPRDNPLGIPYSLVAESCLPAFVTNDVESIFEEYQICSSSNLHQVLQTVEAEGVFVRDDNKFLFTHVLVGHQATARFKISNVSKVPCEVLLSIRPITRKLKSHPGHIFAVDPVRMSLPSCSHAFATVTFTPQKAQSYCCTFEASLEVHTRPAAVGAASLSFGISGAGKLPAVRVLRPALRGRGGSLLLRFGRLPLGARQELPLVLRNSAAVPAQVLLDLLDEEGVFSLRAGPTTKCLYQGVGMKDSAGEERQLHTARLLLRRGEAAEFQVVFQPRLAQRLEGKILVSVLDNPREETTIRLVGEGHDEDFTLDNVQGLVAGREEQDLPESSLEEDMVEAAQGDHIQFGDCPLGTPCTVTFTVTNRSKGQALRFQWLPEAPFHFSPQVGHLRAGCAKDIGVTLQSQVEVTFRRHPVKCLVSRISFQLPPEEVPDWDDCLGRVKWVDSTKPPGARWPVKKQVLEPEAEPAHSVLEGSSREVQLLLSAAVRCPELQLATEGPESSSSQEVSSGQAQGSARMVAGSAQPGQVPGCSLPPGQLSSQGRGTGTASGSSVLPAQPAQSSCTNARGGSAEGNTSSEQASGSISPAAAVLLATSRNAGADVSQVPGSSSSSIALPQVAGSQQAAAE